MKFHISKSWSSHAADGEHGINAAAGSPLHGFVPQTHADSPFENRIAFSQFLSLSRRKKGLSVAALAAKTDIDEEDLLAIERDPHARIEPRIVQQLSGFFGVPAANLMVLAGLAVRKGTPLAEGAVRAAALSASMASLTREESHILDQLLSALTTTEGT